MATDLDLERKDDLAQARLKTPEPSAPVQDVGQEWSSFQRKYLGVSEQEDYRVRKEEQALQHDYAKAQRAHFKKLQELAKKLSRPSFLLWVLALLIVVVFDILDIIEVLLEAGFIATGAGAPIAGLIALIGRLKEIIPMFTVIIYMWLIGRKYKKYQAFQKAMQEGVTMAAREQSIFESYEMMRELTAQIEQHEQQTAVQKQGTTKKVAPLEMGQTSPQKKFETARLQALAKGRKVYHVISATVNFLENPWGFVKTMIFVALDRFPWIDIVPFDTWTVFSSGRHCYKAYRQVLEEWEGYQKSELART